MDTEAFAEQIVAMQDTLYRVSYSLLREPCDREDAVQEAIRRAWEHRNSLRNDDYLRTWVVRILLNECYRLLRKRTRETPVDTLPEREAPPDADRLLHDAFLSLEEPLRVVMVLRFIEEYDLRSIARILRIPEGTVKSRINRARKKLSAPGREVYLG